MSWPGTPETTSSAPTMEWPGTPEQASIPTAQATPLPTQTQSQWPGTPDIANVAPQSYNPITLGKEFFQRNIQGGVEQVASNLQGIGARMAGPSPFDTALRLAAKGPNANPEIQQLVADEPQRRPVTEQPLYKAGQAISEFVKPLGNTPNLNPVVGDVAAGFGSVGANIVTGLVPGIGPGLAATLTPFGGAGEAAERAVKAKATPEEQIKAAQFGIYAGATDLADNLLPIMGSTGKALGLVRRVGSRVLMGALTEGGQEGLQQFIQNLIAKGVYKPSQDLSEDVLYNAFIGAIVGGTTSGAIGGRGEGRPEEISLQGLEATLGLIQRTPPETGTPLPVGVAPQAQGQAAPSPTNPNGSPVKEKVEFAAVKIGDEIYTGRTHSEAIDRAALALGKSNDQILDDIKKAGIKGGLDGFVTSNGRYVDRLEATKIAENVSQWRGGIERPDVGEPMDALDVRLKSPVSNLDRILESTGAIKPEPYRGKPQTEPQAPPQYGDARFIGRNSDGNPIFERPDRKRIADEPSSTYLENDLSQGRLPRYLVESDIQKDNFGTSGTTIPLTPQTLPDDAVRAMASALPIEADSQPGTTIIPVGTLVQSMPQDVSLFPATTQLTPQRIITPVHSSFLSKWVERIAPVVPDPIHTQIANLVKSRISQVAPDVMVHVLSDQEMTRMYSPTMRGAYVIPHDPRFKPVILLRSTILSDPKVASHTVLHEGIHAATSILLAHDPLFNSQVQALMEETRRKIESLSSVASYAFVDTHEFLAQAFSSPEFQHILANVRASRELISELKLEGPKPTLWQAFVQMVRRVLGLNSNLETYSMLEATLRVGSRVIDAQARMLGDKARPDIASYVDGLKENQRALDEASKDVPAVGIQPETSGTRDDMFVLFSGNVPQTVKQAAAHADKMNWGYKWLAGLDQLVQANLNFSPLVLYKQLVQAMHLEESNLDDMALRIGKDWRRLRDEGDRLSNYLNELVHMSYRSPTEVTQGISRHPSKQEEDALRAKHQITDKGARVLDKIKILMDGFFNLVQENAVAGAKRSVLEVGAQTRAITALTEQAKAIKSRPYFPFMRFGRHYVMVKDVTGRLVHFETVERQGVRSAETVQTPRKAELQKAALTGHTVESGILPESVGPLVGMPPMLLDQMKQAMLLTPEQLNSIPMLQLVDQLRGTPVLHPKYQRKYFVPSYSVHVPGYSMDFKRSFAKFFFHGAKFYTKTKYLQGLEDVVAKAEAIPDNKANKIAEYMRDHLTNTIKDARGDFGIFKAGIFIWAMGYVPAAATQNLSQTPMITFPYLAAKFGGIGIGDARASRAITKAMVQFKNFYKRGYYDTQSAFEMRAIQYGIKTGRISETQAPELAGMSQANNLLLGIGGNAVQRGWLGFQEKAAWMFEMAEQFNRRVAFRATLDLSLAHPKSPIIDQAVKANQLEYDQLLKEGNSEAEARAIITASHVVEETQYTYSRWARPRFMRGRLPGTLFVFKKYMQSTLWMLANNRSDVLPRYLLVAAFIGGLGNLPGMEDLRGILKAIGAWRFGKNFDIQREARKYILQFSDGQVDPDLILHGMARRGMGVGALLDLAGSFATGTPGRGLAAPKHVAGVPFGFAQNIPFPVLDRHAALGMGLISPVDVGALATPTNDIDKRIAEQTQKASGAVFSVGFNIYKAIMDNHLAASDWKRWERAVPRELGAMSKSFRAFTEGRERSKGGPNAGTTVVDYDPNDTEQMMEALALSMGYQPLRVQARWDNIMAKVEVEKFYDMQRKGLLEQLFEAHSGGNEKEIGDVVRSIREFNDGLPDEARGKKITPETADKSIQAQARGKIAREAGVPTIKSNIPLSQEMDRLFPEATIDVRRVR